MPTTRSATGKKTLQSETVSGDVDPAQSPSPTASARNAHKKRKHSQSQPPKTSKKPKTTQRRLSSSDNIEKLEKPIVINRAPVLQLWGAVVANFLHPDLTWPACLSIGNAISALCAVSKGRAIGMIKPKDTMEEPGEKDEQKKKSQDRRDENQVITVMGFNLPLADDAVLLGAKPKPLNESTLKAKFGNNEAYDAVKQAMSDGLDAWADDKNALDKKAFHMYEQFRPNVATGQRGWGRKGELDLHEIARVVKRTGD